MKKIFKMKSKIKTALSKYASIENKLNQIFNETNFCADKCITRTNSFYSDLIPYIDVAGNIGCCIRNFNELTYKHKKDEDLDLDMLNRKKAFFEKQKEENNNILNHDSENEYCPHHTTNEGCLINDTSQLYASHIFVNLTINS